jgi:hypothetical protein
MKDFQDERRPKAYRYAVANGVRQVTMLCRHVPSHLTAAGLRILLSYERQSATRYGCGEVGRVYQGCPARQKSGTVRPNLANTTNASIVTDGVAPAEDPVQDVTSVTGHIADKGSTKFAINALYMPGYDMDINLAQEMAPTYLTYAPRWILRMGQTLLSPTCNTRP